MAFTALAQPRMSTPLSSAFSPMTRGALLRALVLTLLPCLLLAGPGVAYTEEAADPLQPVSAVAVLLRLAERVNAGDEFDRVDFAWVAIAEMAASFEAAAERSRYARAKNEHARKKLQRWRSSTLAYAQHLRQQLLAIQQGAPVSVHVQEPSTLVVLTNGQPTVINGPQALDQGELARQILLNYCSLHVCPEQEELEAEETAGPIEPANGQWSFDQTLAASYETPDGLVFQFGRLDDREATQAACDRLVAELRLVASRLRQLHQAGTPIAWHRLRILSAGGADQHRLLINDAGRSLLLSLPDLYLAQDLMREAAPWLEAQAEGTTERQVFRRAEHFTRLLPQTTTAPGPAYWSGRQPEPEIQDLHEY